jgi:hypothetical protein
MCRVVTAVAHFFNCCRFTFGSNLSKILYLKYITIYIKNVIYKQKIK